MVLKGGRTRVFALSFGFQTGRASIQRLDDVLTQTSAYSGSRSEISLGSESKELLQDSALVAL